jgi:Protein of unknown function (DUF1203)
MKAPFRVPANTRIPLIVIFVAAQFADQGGFSISAVPDRSLPQNSMPEFRRCENRCPHQCLIMKKSTFRIVPLATEIAEAARRGAASGAPDHTVVVADSTDGYPCRHCLRFAKKGERVILFPYASIPAGQPYFETGPIFVHEQTCERYSMTDEFPPDLRQGRVMRAYNSNYEMIDAEVVDGSEPEAVVEKLLEKSETAFVDARSVTRGCYTFRIQRQ